MPLRPCSRCGADVPEEFHYCGRCGAPAADPDSTTLLLDAESPDELLRRVRQALAGEYVIEAQLGSGGMAAVFKATEVANGRLVALKVLPAQPRLSSKAADRFRREGRLVSGLEHANIIPVYSVGQKDDTPFIAMKLIEGRSLDAIIDHQGPLSVPVVLSVLQAASRGLGFAHAQGIVHRDVKSANILVDGEGLVMVSDFGLALQSEDLNLTTTGTVMGTPLYMSPEQCSGRRIGPPSDQYSLGVVAFQMLAGQVPFRAETLAGLMQHHFFTPVPDLRQVRDDIPGSVIDLVSRMLAKAPGNRFASMDDLLTALGAIPLAAKDQRAAEALLGDLARGVQAAPVASRAVPPLPDLPAIPFLQPPGRARILWWALPAAAAAGVVVFGVAASGLLRGTDRAGREAPPITSAPESSSVSVALTPPDTAVRPPQRITTPARPVAPVPMGKLRLQTTPTDAEILVDGRTVGTGSAIDVQVRAGDRRLEVRAAGYVTFDTVVTVGPDATVRLGRVTLRAAGGSE